MHKIQIFHIQAKKYMLENNVTHIRDYSIGFLPHMSGEHLDLSNAPNTLTLDAFIDDSECISIEKEGENYKYDNFVTPVENMTDFVDKFFTIYVMDILDNKHIKTLY